MLEKGKKTKGYDVSLRTRYSLLTCSRVTGVTTENSRGVFLKPNYGEIQTRSKDTLEFGNIKFLGTSEQEYVEPCNNRARKK